jgi:hypothetical protein
MLHPLNIVACEAEMMRLVQFQRSLLELAVRLRNGDSKNEALFRNVLGDDAGVWFWTKYRGDGAWTRKFDDLCVQCPSLINEQRELLNAFDWDIQFHSHLTDANWSFKFPLLNTLLKDAIKVLFEHCYNYLGTSGYNESVHGTPDLLLTRKQFLKSYTSENLQIKVCPVCDARAEEHAYDDIFVRNYSALPRA